MAKYTIQQSGGERVPAGTYLDSLFIGIEEFESEKGTLLRWKFELPNKLVATGITGADKPTEKNRLRKFLCGLAKAPLKAGTTVDPDEYIGKKYLVIVSENDKGTSIEMFTALW